MSHSLSTKSRCTKDSSHGPALPKDLQPQGCIKTSHPPAGVVIEALKAYLIVQKVRKEAFFGLKFSSLFFQENEGSISLIQAQQPQGQLSIFL